GLVIELAAGPAQRTTRLARAIQTLEDVLVGVRAGAFTTGHPAAGWKLNPGDPDHPYTEADFDEDWVFWGAYGTWQGAMRAFIYPESHLLPTLRPAIEKGHLDPKSRPDSAPTNAYKDLIKNRSSARVTPKHALDTATEYLTNLRSEFSPVSTFPAELKSDAFKI